MRLYSPGPIIPEEFLRRLPFLWVSEFQQNLEVSPPRPLSRGSGTARKSLSCKPALDVSFWRTPSTSKVFVNNLGQTGRQRLWNFSSQRVELLVKGGQRCLRFFARSTNLAQWLLPPGQCQLEILASRGDSLSNSEPGDCW